MSLGQTIQQARRAAGLRQSDLAEKIGRSTYYVALIEQSRRRPSKAVAVAISQVLGVSLDVSTLRPYGSAPCHCGARHHAHGFCQMHAGRARSRGLT